MNSRVGPVHLGPCGRITCIVLVQRNASGSGPNWRPRDCGRAPGWRVDIAISSLAALQHTHYQPFSREPYNLFLMHRLEDLERIHREKKREGSQAGPL